MSKSIVLFCDGTWNKPEDEHGLVHPTNVLRFMRLLKPKDNNLHQIVYYDTGIGTGGVWDKYVGGAFGLGISNNIMDAYRFLANNWAEGDRIFMLGFSRGAYTVRSLAGFVHFMGLLHKESMPAFPLCYQYYRAFSEDRLEMKQAQLVESLRETISQANRRPPIHFLGVWDTVGALGVTLPGFQRLSRGWVGFHNTQLSSTIRHAVHALALDETRSQFAANLWTYPADPSTAEAGSPSPSIVSDQVLQVWFPGVHSDVGGGYPDSDISDQALAFMIAQARRHGLQFYESSAELAPSSAPEHWLINDETKGIYRLSPRHHRPIGDQQRLEAGLELAVNEKIHESTVQRLNAGGSFQNGDRLREALRDGMAIYHERDAARITLPGTGKSGSIIHVDFSGSSDGEQRLACKILDYSDRGARIDCSESAALRPGKVVQFQTEDQRVRSATVRWQHDSTAGIQFNETPAA
ncbi:DUF2235 domain-containing protein [Allohahella marinimesophila]|uniref:DUF2235 domain-containing protein n=1 Tax=Allohahella marinimesophila TaxID=1054972 RepID=A0ABP7QAI0_9GAMM